MMVKISVMIFFLLACGKRKSTKCLNLKVSKFQKQFLVSSILPKNEQNSISWASSVHSEFCLFFGRIEKTNFVFRDRPLDCHITMYIHAFIFSPIKYPAKLFCFNLLSMICFQYLLCFYLDVKRVILISY